MTELVTRAELNRVKVFLQDKMREGVSAGSLVRLRRSCVAGFDNASGGRTAVRLRLAPR